MNILKKLLTLTTAAALACAAFVGCADKNSPAHDASEDVASTAEASSGSDEDEDIEYAEAGDWGDIIITLYPDIAPITCENFESLVSEGFYDGLTFHRVVEDFMAQGGDPNGDGTGGNDETITGEFSENGVENDLSHTRGIVSMARSQDYDSASSQFFICYTDCSYLDGSYAAFGEVTEGMEIVDKFLEVPRTTGTDGAESYPLQTITITKATMIDDDEDGNPRAQLSITVGEAE
ncbi:MAG: peptidylprolyl isomerase [Ruminococcus sp.]|nr:peptidylprolyl isomerase [Ruminococcus sp.]